MSDYMNSLILLVCVVLLAFSVHDSKQKQLVLEENLETMGLSEVTSVNPVSCLSDSMGLTIGCNDKLLLKPFNESNVLMKGSIYVYKNPYTGVGTTVHRLVEFNQTHALFKGDNNAVADPWVQIIDIEYLVLGVTYNGLYQ